MLLPYRSLTFAPTCPLMMGLRLSSALFLGGPLLGSIFLGAAVSVSSAPPPPAAAAPPVPAGPTLAAYGDPPPDDPSGSLGIVLAALVTLAGPRYVDDRFRSGVIRSEFWYRSAENRLGSPETIGVVVAAAAGGAAGRDAAAASERAAVVVIDAIDPRATPPVLDVASSPPPPPPPPPPPTTGMVAAARLILGSGLYVPDRLPWSCITLFWYRPSARSPETCTAAAAAAVCVTVVPPAGGWADVIFPTEPKSFPVPADVPAACDTVVPPGGGADDVMDATAPPHRPLSLFPLPTMGMAEAARLVRGFRWLLLCGGSLPAAVDEDGVSDHGLMELRYRFSGVAPAPDTTTAAGGCCGGEEDADEETAGTSSGIFCCGSGGGGGDGPSFSFSSAATSHCTPLLLGGTILGRWKPLPPPPSLAKALVTPAQCPSSTEHRTSWLLLILMVAYLLMPRYRIVSLLCRAHLVLAFCENEAAKFGDVGRNTNARRSGVRRQMARAHGMEP